VDNIDVNFPNGAPSDAPQRDGSYSGRTASISRRKDFLRSSRAGRVCSAAIVSDRSEERFP
jgi:hypothetical protein